MSCLVELDCNLCSCRGASSIGSCGVGHRGARQGRRAAGGSHSHAERLGQDQLCAGSHTMAPSAVCSTREDALILTYLASMPICLIILTVNIPCLVCCCVWCWQTCSNCAETPFSHGLLARHISQASARSRSHTINANKQVSEGKDECPARG